MAVVRVVDHIGLLVAILAQSFVVEKFYWETIQRNVHLVEISWNVFVVEKDAHHGLPIQRLTSLSLYLHLLLAVSLVIVLGQQLVAFARSALPFVFSLLLLLAVLVVLAVLAAGVEVLLVVDSLTAVVVVEMVFVGIVDNILAVVVVA